MKEIAHGEPIAIERPVAARQVIGFPSRRSEPGRLDVPEPRAGPVDQEHAQVGVTALTDGAEAPARTRRVFTWREAQIAGEVPRRGKARHVADGGDKGRRGEQADAGNRAQVADSEGIGGPPPRLRPGRAGGPAPLAAAPAGRA